MLSQLLAATALWASYALAQGSSSSFPTVSLFLPMANQTGVVASVVTAAPSATVYAIGCATPSGACVTGCDFDTSVTITEGESTLAYTWTDGDAQLATPGSSLTQDVMTVNCNLLGGTSATQAVCTGQSMNSTQTTTLAGSQLGYVAVTITAGATNMASGTAGGSGSSGSGSGSSPSGSGVGAGSAGASSASETNAGVAALPTAVKYAVGVVAGVAAVGFL